MKKRLLIAIITGIMSISLTGCGSTDTFKSNPSQATVNETEDEENDVKEKQVLGNNISKNDQLVDSDEDGYGYIEFTEEEIIEQYEAHEAEFESYFNSLGLKTEKKHEFDLRSKGQSGNAFIQWVRDDEISDPGLYSVCFGGTVHDEGGNLQYCLDYDMGDGNTNPPKARDLYIAEPYKILTGEEISDESLDKIDKILQDAFVNGINDDESDMIIEEKGNYAVKVSTHGYYFKIIIISGGEVKHIYKYKK